MQDGADHEPSGKREMTRPEPAFPGENKAGFEDLEDGETWGEKEE